LLGAPAAYAAQVKVGIDGDWNSAFPGSIVITNDEAATVSDWTLSFLSEFTIDQIWNATVDATAGNEYDIGPLDWNKNIAPGAQVSFSFTDSPGSGVTLPTNFTVNGTATTTGTTTGTTVGITTILYEV
jgi:endoglucanase